MARKNIKMRAYFQEFKSKNSAFTSSISQCGKQGLACSPRDHFTTSVTVIKWYKREQKTCAVFRLAGVSIILVKMEQGNKWIERKEEKGEKRRNSIFKIKNKKI